MIKYLLLFLAPFCMIHLHAQPESPAIYGVTYSHENYFTIGWNYNTTTYEGFVVSSYDGVTNNGASPKYKFLKNESSQITTVDIPEDTVIFFAVEATVNGVTSSANTARWPWRNAPSNILLKYKFDSCSLDITLKWNRYYYPQAWNDYILYCDGIRFDKINYEKVNDTTFIIKYDKYKSKLQVDNKVEFQIILNKDNIYSTSNKVVFEMSKQKRAPSFIEATGTNVWEEQSPLSSDDLVNLSEMVPSKLKLNFYVDPTSELNRFVVYRSKENEILGFDSIGYIQGGPYLTFEDTTIDSILNKQYFYKIAVINSCNQPGIESNVESTIPLKLETKNNSINSLEWTEYKKFKGKLKEYNVYRIRANSGAKKLQSYQGTSASDNLETLDDKDVKEIVCYYVEALEENNPNGVNTRTISNLACMTLPESIDMPKFLVLGASCTPNPNSLYHFKPAGGVAKPSSYYLAITDRWGTKVFETNDINEGWDGSVNGKAVPQGGYMYYYKYVGKTGAVEKHGSFVVLCP